MGYYAHSEQSDFIISRERFPKVLETLHEKYPEYNPKDDLFEIIAEIGFTVETDKSGNIDEMYYEYSKFHSDEIDEFFSFLAPFVESGSYITFRGEDDSVWAYYFDGSGVEEYPGETIFPGMPMDGPKKPSSKSCTEVQEVEEEN